MYLGGMYIEGINEMYCILFCPLHFCVIVFQTKWADTLEQKWHSLAASNMSRQCLCWATSHLLYPISRSDLECQNYTMNKDEKSTCQRFYAMNNFVH